MEGFNYLCLSIFLCPIGLLIGVGVFFLIRFSSQKIITKWFENSKSWVSIPIAVILSVVVAYAVFYSLFAPAFPGYYHPKKEPKNEDIVGVWVLTEHSMEYIDELGYTHAKPSLTLHSSGNFSTTDFPDILFYHRNQVLHSGEGTWKLVRGVQDYWQVELTFDWIHPSWNPDPPLSGPTSCPGLSVPCEGLGFTFDLWNRDPPYSIFKYIGGELGPNIYYHRLGDDYDGS